MTEPCENAWRNVRFGHSKAEILFRRAMAVAQNQGAAFWELRGNFA